MTTSLLELMEELLQAMEQRDAGDPDAPAWEARARIERLTGELSRRLDSGEADEDAVPAALRPARKPEVLAGV